MSTESKRKINPYQLAHQTVPPAPANLLVTQGKAGRPNIMTVSWGLLGELWSKPVFMVAVRPSRYSFTLLEEVPEFTVNVPYPSLQAAIDFCGAESGRDFDKFQECRLTPLPAEVVAPPFIAECAIHFACRVIHTAEASPLTPHRLYFGEILACLADQAVVAGLSVKPI